MTHPTITFIGGGNMARALIGGLVEAGHPPGQITVADPSDVQRRTAESDFGIRSSADNAQAAAGSRIVVLAVKPQIMREVLASIRDVLAPGTLVISVAAGVTLNGLASGLGSERALVRAMPNTPALYGAGMTGMVANPAASDEDQSLAETVMGAAGETIWIDSEDLMDAVTAVSGSCPAYFFALAEQLAAAGEKAGLPAATAARLARQTAHGAGLMLARSELESAELRRRVTSPGGTTEAALNSLATDDFAAMIERAIQAAVRRGRELGAD
jgi:pyrroline-5-carboxylate reductase